MVTNYCKEFGFDEKGIAVRLALFELSDADVEIAEILQSKIIRPNIESIINQFYQFQTSQPDILLYLDNEALIARLRKTQSEYLLSLGCEFSAVVHSGRYGGRGRQATGWFCPRQTQNSPLFIYMLLS